MERTYLISEIYCDGAARGNPGKAGWGSVIELKEFIAYAQFEGQKPTHLFQPIIVELGNFADNATNNQMELTAAFESLYFLLKYNYPKNTELKKIKIHSDSKYVIEGMKNWRFGWVKNNWKTSQGTDVLNKEIWQKLIEVVQSIRSEIEWIHVRGHAGVLLNERADKIATEFADHQKFDCYNGLTQNYDPIVHQPEVLSILNSSQKFPFYLCYINGKLEKFLFWSDCEKKIKGLRGVKFKKISSPKEEAEILARWGVQP